MTEDILIILLDKVDYFFLRLWCRIVGHDWENETEWDGYASHSVGGHCLRCGKH